MLKKTWLVVSVLMVAGLALTTYAGEGEPTYVGDAKCKMCHKAEHASWLETSHAKATDNAKASTDREFSAACLQCHATNADEKLAGVQCEACHGPGSLYKKMSIMKDHEKAVANGLVVPGQETCDGCHTGDDHAAKKVIADEKTNTAAIHAQKAEK